MIESLQPASPAVSKPETFLALVCRSCRILLFERRLPGRFYQIYYSLLNKLGVRLANVKTKNGYTIKGFTHCFFVFYEIWSKKDYDLPGFTLTKGMTVIDIGANQGFYSLYAASQGASVYAFEPCVDNFEILKWNVAKNGLEGRVKLFNEAVAAKKGEVKLFIGLDRAGGIMSRTASIRNSNRGGKEAVSHSVRATTLDSILDDLQIEKCDLLKIDCEGAEYEILHNTSQSSFDKIARISMEAHENRIEEAATILRNAGFEIVFADVGETGLIKACKPVGKVSTKAS
jgi:FkbM family methyltransferase